MLKTGTGPTSSYIYKIGVLWQKSGKGNYVPLFVGGNVDQAGKWHSITTEPKTSEVSARVDLMLVTRHLLRPAHNDNIDPDRYDTKIFLDEKGEPC